MDNTKFLALMGDSNADFNIIVSKDNPGLTTAINKALADMIADGTMDKLVAEWLS